MNGMLPTVRARTAIVLGLVAVYATCFVAIKAGLPYAPPLLFGGLRALIGGICLLGLLIVLRRPVLATRRDWAGVLAVALTATTIGFGAMFLSPGRTGAGIASVLGNAQPLFVVVLATSFLGESMTRGKTAALVLGLLGVTLIAGPALAGPDAYGVSGAALALAASGGLAVGSVIVKRMGARPDVLVLTTWQLIIGSLPLLALSAMLEREATLVWNPELVGLLLFLAVVGTAVANVGWYWLVQREDVGRLTMYLFLVPVFGLGLAALLFGERVGTLEGIGVILTVAGIGALAWDSRPGSSSSDPACQPAPSGIRWRS